MKDLKELVETHVNSGLLFPVNLNEVWQTLGFVSKPDALLSFHSQCYEYGRDYIAPPDKLNVGLLETAQLSIYCFIKWAKTTTKGEVISRIYLDAYYKALER